MDLRDLGAPELDWRRTAGGALADRARKVLGSVGVRPLAPDAVSSRRHRGEGADPIGRYRIEVATPRSRLFAVAGACLLAVLLALPAFGSRNLINELIFVFTMLALAQYWNLLAGYAGLVSVGQQAFVGLGGYLLFALTIHQGLDPLVAILTAGAITAVLAVPTALVVFRLRGAYFAIGTWVVAEVFRLIASQLSALGGGSGISLPAGIVTGMASSRQMREFLIYWVALALVVVVLGAIVLLLRSRYGLALTAIRDNELAARSNGVDVTRTKLVVYILTAFGTAMVGALIFLQKLRISPDTAFSVNDWTAFVIFIVVIGGVGRIEGPILGTALFFVLRQLFADLGSWYLILLGVIAVAIMLKAPRGIWGLLADRYDLQLSPLQRRVRLLDRS